MMAFCIGTNNPKTLITTCCIKIKLKNQLSLQTIGLLQTHMYTYNFTPKKFLLFF